MRRVLVLVLTVIVVGSLSAPAHATAPDPRRWTVQAEGDCSDHAATVRLGVNPAHGIDVPAVATVYRTSGWGEPQGWSYAGGLSYNSVTDPPVLVGNPVSYVSHEAERIHGGAQTVVYQPPVAGGSAFCALVIDRTGRTLVAVSHAVGVRVDVRPKPMLDVVMRDARRGQRYRLNLFVQTPRFTSRVVHLHLRAQRSGLVLWGLGTVPDLAHFSEIELYSPREHDVDGLTLTRLDHSIAMPSPQAYPTAPTSTPAPTPTTPTPTPTPSPSPTTKPCPLPPLCL